MADRELLNLLKRRMQKANNYPMLLLGAGFSLGAKSRSGKDLMLGKNLVKRLYDIVIRDHWDSLTEDEQREAIDRLKIIDILTKYVQNTDYQDNTMSLLLKEVFAFGKGKGLHTDRIGKLQRIFKEKRNRIMFSEDYEVDNSPA